MKTVRRVILDARNYNPGVMEVAIAGVYISPFTIKLLYHLTTIGPYQITLSSISFSINIVFGSFNLHNYL
jgi:hypothetical protein